MLLLDGSRVISEMKSEALKKRGLMFNQEGAATLINTRWNYGYIGKLKLDEKEFPVRGWSIPVGKLSLLWRYDLVAWICGTMSPPSSFLPVSK
jgi:hypothetical protein